jgi:hypothetical protein
MNRTRGSPEMENRAAPHWQLPVRSVWPSIMVGS